MAADDISYLDFDLPDDLREDFNQETPKSASIVTSVSDMGVLAALCVVNGIEAVVMPSGVFGTVAFLKNLADGAPKQNVEKLTKSVTGLDAVLVQCRFEKMEAKLYRNGEFVQDLIPTIVVGNFPDAAEDALIGELDLFKLVETGEANVNAEHALAHLPSNFVPKKYQKGKSETEKAFNAFPTFAMPLKVAQETLKKFENV